MWIWRSLDPMQIRRRFIRFGEITRRNWGLWVVELRKHWMIGAKNSTPNPKGVVHGVEWYLEAEKATCKWQLVGRCHRLGKKNSRPDQSTETRHFSRWNPNTGGRSSFKIVKLIGLANSPKRVCSSRKNKSKHRQIVVYFQGSPAGRSMVILSCHPGVHARRSGLSSQTAWQNKYKQFSGGPATINSPVQVQTFDSK